MAIQKYQGKTSGRRFMKPVENLLNNEQLRKLDEEVKSFTTMKDGHEDFDIVGWLTHRGALNKYGAVIITNYERTLWNSDGTKILEPADCDPILYEQLMENLEQLYKKRGRKEYAIRKEMEELAATLHG